MAIIKLSFTKLKKGAKASLRYYTHRLTADGRTTTRDIFDQNGNKISKSQAYRKIDRAGEHVTFFRLIISPDPNSEDKGKNLKLPELTKDTMIQLQRILGKKRAIEYLGIAHTDHSQHRHVHAICFISGKIGKDQLRKLREAATQASVDQHWTLSADNDAPRPRSRRFKEQQHRSASIFRNSAAMDQRPRQIGGFRTLGRYAPSCPSCGRVQRMNLRGRYFECPHCGLAIGRPTARALDTTARTPTLELTLEEVRQL